eukprot:4892951-Pyramimonas_sp.AAC.1
MEVEVAKGKHDQRGYPWPEGVVPEHAAGRDRSKLSGPHPLSLGSVTRLRFLQFPKFEVADTCSPLVVHSGFFSGPAKGRLPNIYFNSISVDQL